MKKILIVDDTRTVHTFVKSITKQDGYNYKDAFNGQEALDMLEKENFDLVLLDWEMPVLNGPDTLKKIVQLYPETPVVMMTTKNSFEDVSSMMNAGAREYLMKPFTREIFLEKIHGFEEGGFGNAV